MKRLGGWQRLWFLCSALYVVALLIAVLSNRNEQFPGGLIGLLCAVVLPPSALYLGGLGTAWIIQGFRDSGWKRAGPWQRLWAVSSIAFLLITGVQLVEGFRHAAIADRVFNETLTRGENVSYYVDSDDSGKRQVYAQVTSKDSRDWVRLGSVVAPESQSILEKTGEWHPEARHWTVSKDGAISLLKKHRAHDFMFSIMSVLVKWIIPPLAAYLLVFSLVLSISWVYAGFKIREGRVSA